MIKQSWVQILSRTSVLPKPQMIWNEHFFSSDKITLFALRTNEFYRNIGNLESMKRKMLVKRNWRKSRIIFLLENEHQVTFRFSFLVYWFWFCCSLFRMYSELNIRLRSTCSNLICKLYADQTIRYAVTRWSLDLDVWGANFGPVKSDTVLSTAHLCIISSKGVLLPACAVTRRWTANSLHASAQYSEYNEKIWFEVQTNLGYWTILFSTEIGFWPKNLEFLRLRLRT